MKNKIKISKPILASVISGGKKPQVKKQPSEESPKGNLKAMLFKRRIPIVWMLCSWVVPIFIFSIYSFINSSSHHPEMPQPEQNSSMYQIRQGGFHLIHPLLTADLALEDSHDGVIKANIERYINEKKKEGVLEEASVYFRQLNDGGWFSINPEKSYAWGSLGKLPLMTSYLADAEPNRALLDKKIYFEKSISPFYQHINKAFTLSPKKYYSIHELLHYMIAYSDNDALDLLYQNMNQKTVNKLLSDLQIPIPDLSKDVNTITVTQYSMFFRILYSSTYLSRDLSEYALNLLTQCDFKDGICKNIPSNILVAHKFGERSSPTSAQLHEFGIVYVKGKPYLLGIMTKGYDNKQLTKILADISGMVYNFSGNENP